MAAGEALSRESRDVAAEDVLETVEGAADTGTAAALDELSGEDQ
jgi:hypothetical protein